MSAQISDLFNEPTTTTRPDAAALTAQKLIGAASITVDTTAGWPTATAVHFVIYQVTAAGTRVEGTQTEWKGIVTSATAVGTLTLQAGTDQVYPIGSKVICTPTAAWGDDLIEGILVEHTQTGSHVMTSPKVITGINDTNGNELIKVTATASAVNEITVTNAATAGTPVISATGGDSAVNLNLRGKGLAKTVTIGAGATIIFPYDYVVSGCVWAGDAYASTLAASMTAGVVVINGNPVTVAAVTARAFTASKDVYIDVLDNGDGTGLLVYTDGTINAASPALASNSVRIGIIVTGAGNIASAASVNQGEENKLVPIASSVPYAVTDSLGNLICPRDPNRKILGYKQIVNTPTFTTIAQITGLSVPVIVPANRKIKVSFYTARIYNSGIAENKVPVFDGSIGGTAFMQPQTTSAAGSHPITLYGEMVQSPSAGLHTYNAAAFASATTMTIDGSTTPTYLKVELV